jgi:hypothetical protein
MTPDVPTPMIDVLFPERSFQRKPEDIKIVSPPTVA